MKLFYLFFLIGMGCKPVTNSIIGKWELIEAKGGGNVTKPAGKFVIFSADSIRYIMEATDTTVIEDSFRYEYFDTLLKETSINKFGSHITSWKIDHIKNGEMSMQCINCVVDTKYILKKVK